MIALELIILFLVILSMIAIIVVSYGIQQEKYRINKKWMDEQLKQDKEL